MAEEQVYVWGYGTAGILADTPASESPWHPALYEIPSEVQDPVRLWYRPVIMAGPIGAEGSQTSTLHYQLKKDGVVVIDGMNTVVPVGGVDEYIAFPGAGTPETALATLQQWIETPPRFSIYLARAAMDGVRMEFSMSIYADLAEPPPPPPAPLLPSGGGWKIGL